MSNDLLEFLDKEIYSLTSVIKSPKKDTAKNLDFLSELINKEVDKLTSLLEDKGKSLDVSTAWKSIPLPTLSEMGWADPSRKGGEIADETRSEMAQYLAPVTSESASLEEAIQNLQNFIDKQVEGAGDERENPMSLSQLLSFLVFYKTLTHIISNFNKATAGFLFESLLGVLTGGQQIPAKGAGGGETIADFKYRGGKGGKGAQRWVSLKLLTSGGTDIDGSFTDLINDLSDPAMNHKMQYVVVLKALKGNKDKMTGALVFYEFEFNKETIYDFLSQSTAGQESLRIPNQKGRALLDGDAQQQTRWSSHSEMEALDFYIRDFFERGGPGGDSELPEDPNADEFRDLVDDAATKLTSAYKSIRHDMGVFEGSKRSPEYKELERVYEEMRAMIFPDDDDTLNPWKSFHTWENYRGIGDKEFGGRTKAGGSIDRMYPVFKNLLAFFKRIMEEDTGQQNKKKPNWSPSPEEEFMIRAQSIGKKGTGTRWLSIDESWKELSEEKDLQKFWNNVRRYSYGYLFRKRFIITQDNMKELTGEPFAVIKVGKDIIHSALTKMINDINGKMFRLFREMDILSRSLREFFMNDMDESKGKEAQSAAEAVKNDTFALVNPEEEIPQ